MRREGRAGDANDAVEGAREASLDGEDRCGRVVVHVALAEAALREQLVEVVHEEPQVGVALRLRVLRRATLQERGTELQHVVLRPVGHGRMEGAIEPRLHHGGVARVALVEALGGGTVRDAERVEDGHRGDGGGAVERGEGGVVVRDVVEHGGQRRGDKTAGALPDAGETAELLAAGVVERVAVGAERGGGRGGGNGLAHDHVDAEGADVLLVDGLVLSEEFGEEDEMRVDGTGDGDEGFEEAERGVVAVVQTEAVEEEGGDLDVLADHGEGGGEVAVLVEVAQLHAVAPDHQLALQVLGVDHVVGQLPVDEEGMRR